MNHKVTNIWSKQDWKWIVCVMTSLTSLVITINESIFLMFFSQCISFVSRNNTYVLLSKWTISSTTYKTNKNQFCFGILYYINTWCSGLLCLSFESNILNHYRPRFFKILKQSQFMIFSLGNYKKQPIVHVQEKKNFSKSDKMDWNVSIPLKRGPVKPTFRCWLRSHWPFDNKTFFSNIYLCWPKRAVEPLKSHNF